jgi:aminopeptidase N/puromycin-sensitive aminopeptidase
MAPHVEKDLTAPERLSLLGDEWSLVRAGRHSAADYLTLATGFGRETSSGVLTTLADRLGFMKEYLTTSASRAPFEAFVRTLVRPTFETLGFAPRPADTPEQRTLRAVAIVTLGNIGNDGAVAQQARDALDKALAGGPALDPTLAGAIVSVAAAHGDAQLYDKLSAAAAKASSPLEHYRYLYALTDFDQPELIDRGLNYALSPDLRSQDTAIYFARFFGNPAARDRAWSFLKAHWDALEPKITISLGDVNLVNSLSAFCDPAARDDITSFFAAHKLPAATRTLSQTIERIDNCLELKQQQAGPVTTWLQAQK